MRNVSRLIRLAILALAATPAHGQELPGGDWPGTLKLPGVAALNVMFSVERDEQAVEVSMKTGQSQPDPVSDVRLGDGTLAFHWRTFDCGLRKKGNKYEGSCRDVDGTEGKLSLTAKVSTVKT